MRENKNQQGVLVLGEVLFDVFPDYRRIGGAPFNVAFHLHQLGVPVRFVSRIGLDDPGREVLEFCGRFGFPVDDIQQDPVKPTGEVRVMTEVAGGHRFDILPDQAYDYLSAVSALEGLAENPPKLVYFGTLAQRNGEAAKAVQKTTAILKERCTVVVDLNLRAPFYGREAIEFSLEAADALKINDQELVELAALMNLKEVHGNNVRDLMERFSIEQVVVTRGPEGSELYQKGEDMPLHQGSIAPQSLIDSVGAGDAFCALWMEGLYRNRDSHATLELAARFAGVVCGLEGALPVSGEFYREFRNVS